MSSRHYPITTKESEDMENKKLICGGTSMQGWRTRQEVTYRPLRFRKTIHGLQLIS